MDIPPTSFKKPGTKTVPLSGGVAAPSSSLSPPAKKQKLVTQLRKPISPVKQAFLNTPYSVLPLTPVELLTKPDGTNKLYGCLAITQNHATGEYDLLPINAWMKQDSKPKDALQKMAMFKPYHLKGAMTGKSQSFHPECLVVNNSTKITETEDFKFDPEKTQETVKNLAINISKLSDSYDGQRVLLVGRINSIDTVDGQSNLKAKLVLYDDSDVTVEMAVFQQQWNEIQKTKLHELLVVSAKVNVNNGVTNLTLTQFGKDPNRLGVEIIKETQILTTDQVHGLVNISNNKEIISNLLSIRPDRMIWFPRQTILVKAVSDDYVDFLCSLDKGILYLRGSNWWCGECKKAIADDDIFFKCNPIISILIGKEKIDTCYVKEGQELVLFQKTCKEIVYSQEVVDPVGKKFTCTIGVGPRSVQIIHLLSMD